jgi:thiamine biosynthesis lipoprotein
VTDITQADQAQRLVQAYLATVGAACSRFEPSELACVQAFAAAGGDMLAVPISELLADLVDAALDAARRTGGDVDPTLAGDLSALGYDRDFARLSQVQLPRVQPGAIRTGAIRVSLVRRRRHDWRDVRLTGAGTQSPRLQLPPGVHLDLGASAKAFAADRSAELVAAQLGCGVLVALGGDIAVAGAVPDGGWQILVQDGAGQPASTVALHAGGMATSSTLSRAWQHGTRAIHHILDPATGQPAEPVWRTVTVVAGSCAEANMLSTASIVRGWKGLAPLRDAGLPARLVGGDGHVLRLGGWPADDQPGRSRLGRAA